MDSNNTIRIWHWNANSFRCCRAVLQQHIRVGAREKARRNRHSGDASRRDPHTHGRVGINPLAHGGAEDDELESQVTLRDEAARGIIVFPLPKNVNPEKDWERRKARAVTLAKQYRSDENAAFVMLAKHPSRRCVYAMAVTRASTGELINASTTKAKTPCQAEEVAIGLAMGVLGIRTILSDSKTAQYQVVVRATVQTVMCAAGLGNVMAQ
ncbi:hypothetical protein MRX96_005977 [Rhipicephalus microplus]